MLSICPQATAPPAEYLGSVTAPKPKSPPVHRSTQRLFSGNYLQVDQEVHGEVSRTQVREIIRVRDGVGILALTRDGMVPLVSQFRAAIGEITREIPAGLVDDGETPLEAARRELSEEAGLHGGEWIHLRRYAQAEGYSSGWIDLFLALDCERGENHPVGDEDLDLSFHAFDDLLETLPFQDAKSMLSLLFSRPILDARGRA